MPYYTYIYLLAWSTCHAIWGFYLLECLFYALLLWHVLMSLGELVILIGAFMSCNAYFMPYYIYYSCTYIACDTWCTCHAYGGFYVLIYYGMYLYHLVNLSYL